MKKLIIKSLSVFGLMSLLSSCNQVETTQPEQRDIINAVFASGHVISDHEYQVTANAEGYLVRRFVDEGAVVQSNMPLFQLSNDIQSENVSSAEINYQDALRKLDINSPERAQLELQISLAQTQLELDKKNYERYKKLVAKKAVSQVEFENARYQFKSAQNNAQLKQKALDDFIKTLEINEKNAKSQLIIQKSTNDDYFLTSTIDGIVLKVFKQPGELVKRGEVIALIGGGQKLVKLFVAEEDIEEVAIDQQVYINLNTQKDQNFKGSITKIYPSFDEVEQSFIVEASFNKAPEKLYHNAQLQANIIIDKIENAWVIPPDFVSEGNKVYVKGEGKKLVKLGIRNDQWIQVLSGLDAQQTLQKEKRP
ncbi:MAG: HlyD family efflux transporter periplasmic adaptor subunit [Bacteroidota bacterium]